MLRVLKSPIALLSASLLLLPGLGHAEDQAEERVVTDEQGRITINPIATPDHLRNPWPAALEDEFVSRRDKFIRQYVGKAGVNTSLENEKQGYPPSILAFCAGDRADALAALQAGDNEAGHHAHTKGIDLYWCFTLKGQMRKYFFLGQYLDPAYKATMKEGGAAWTATDTRPNTELVLLTTAKDPEVAAYAMEAMSKIWRDEAGLEELAKAAEEEFAANSGGQNHLKKKFADYIRANKTALGSKKPTTPEEWLQWWEVLCKGDWMIYEEYDRRTNLRPHPQFGIGKGPVGADWSPGTRGGIADWRNTDNLRGMRECSIYLMAEETGSELVRKVFKERIRYTARNFLSIGNGEWDSPAYLSHTASAYINLYDFAKDEEVRLMAKAILDFCMTSAAVKYYKLGFCGPNCRDYGTVTSHSGPSAMIDFYAGQHTTHPENDIAHYATSAYRPPAAVVSLARKEFQRPVEIFASHPHYQNFQPRNQNKPKYHETTYIANSYQIGSQIEGGQYDVNGCKILIENDQDGVDFFVPSSQTKGNICVNRNVNDRFAQSGNLLLGITKPKPKKDRKTKELVPTAADFSFLIPAGAEVEIADGIVFLKMHQTWAAVRGINADFQGIDKKRHGNFRNKKKQLIPGQMISGKAKEAGQLAGYVIELGESQSHGDYAAFKAAVTGHGNLTVDNASGTFSYAGALGQRSVGLTWAKEGLVIRRNGEVHDLSKHMAIWQPVDGGKAPVSLGWKTGVLHVEAGGHSFTGTFDREAGTYSFTQSLKE